MLRPAARLGLAVLCAGGVCVGLGSCGSDSGPAAPDPLPVPRTFFEPEPGEIEALGGGRLTFRVRDASGQPVTASWFVDGKSVAIGRIFEFEVPGAVVSDVLARAVIDGEVHLGRWTVQGVLVRFTPAEPDLWMLADQEVEFAVEVSGGAEAPVSFSLDGETVAGAARFRFAPAAEGLHRIEARTEVLGEVYGSSWDVRVTSLELSPPAGEVPTRAYEWVTLRARRADGLPLGGSFTIQDYGSAVGDSIRYRPVVAGTREARVRYENAAGSGEAAWMLVDASPVPAVGELRAQARDFEDVVDLSWEIGVPGPDQQVPDAYLVAWAEDWFGVDERTTVQHRTVPHREGVAVQGTAVEGLDGQTTYCFRVFPVDGQGREGFGSSPVGATTDDVGVLVSVSGRVQVLPWTGGPVPAAGVTLDPGPGGLVLPASGTFDLTVRSNGQQFLRATGETLHPMAVGPLPRSDVRYELLMVPERTVTVVVDGIASELALVDYLRRLTDNDNSRDEDPFFHAWGRYPVKVWVWPYRGTGTEQPSYDAAFRRAIDRWNGGATGEARLFEYVAVSDSVFDPSGDAGEEGVLVRLYPMSSSNLGEVVFLRPVGGKVATTDPELLALKLRRGLPTQEVVDWVVAHELGHVLGLRHSPSPEDLMHAYANRAQGVPRDHERYVARFLRHVARDASSRWY